MSIGQNIAEIAATADDHSTYAVEAERVRRLVIQGRTNEEIVEVLREFSANRTEDAANIWEAEQWLDRIQQIAIDVCEGPPEALSMEACAKAFDLSAKMIRDQAAADAAECAQQSAQGDEPS